jgi:hypothetical protein
MGNNYLFTMEFIVTLLNTRTYPKEWRLGQAAFNLYYVLFPEIVNKLRTTDVDCFFDDTKVELFINKLTELVKEIYGE